MTLTLQALAGVAAAAAVGAGSLVAGQGPGGDDGPRIPCGAVWQQLPEELRSDLTGLRAMTPPERGPALRELRREALGGGYGPQVQRRAEQWVAHRDERRAWMRTEVPEELRRDVRAALRLAPDERHDALARVRDQALSGGYGARVQAGAEALRERAQACDTDPR